MRDLLRSSELLEGLSDEHADALIALARKRTLDSGQYLFLLGDSASHLFVVLSGRVDICLPLTFGGSVRDVAVEFKEPGGALGWSALVKPYRFTLSARGAEASEVAAFPRQDLQRLMREDPSLGGDFMGRLAEVVGRRLLKVQALWARELQRAVSGGLSGVPAPVPVDAAPGAPADAGPVAQGHPTP